MKLRNYFEAGGRYYPNAVVDYGGALGSGKPFGAYMKIGALVKPTEVTEYNADVMEGPLYAVFTARLSDGEAAEGECGLTPYEDGSLLMNRVVLEKTETESVSAAVYIETAGEANFCGGENPLVRMLLGLDGFSAKTGGPDGFELFAGKNYFDGNEPIYREADSYDYRTSAKAVLTEGALELSGRLSNSEPRENVFLYAGKPAVRWYNTRYNKLATYTRRADTRGELKEPDFFSADIFNVTMDGQPISCGVGGVPRRMGRRKLIRFRLGENPRFVCDAEGKYMAVATDTDVMLLRLAGNEPVISARLPRCGERVMVTSNGALALLGKELRIYEKETGYEESACKTYPLRDTEQAAIVYERGKYHLALYDGALLRRYALDGGVTELGELREEGLVVFAADKRSIGYVSRAGTVGCKTIQSYDVNIEETLASFMSDFGTVTELWADQGVLVMTADDVRYGLNIYEVGGTEITAGRLLCGSGGSYAIVGNGITEIAVRSVTEDGIGEIGYCAGEDFVTLGRLGRYVILARADGSTESFYTQGSQKYIYSDAIAGKTVTFTVREIVDVKALYAAFDIKIRLEWDTGG